MYSSIVSVLVELMAFSKSISLCGFAAQVSIFHEEVHVIYSSYMVSLCGFFSLQSPSFIRIVLQIYGFQIIVCFLILHISVSVSNYSKKCILAELHYVSIRFMSTTPELHTNMSIIQLSSTLTLF